MPSVSARVHIEKKTNEGLTNYKEFNINWSVKQNELETVAEILESFANGELGYFEAVKQVNEFLDQVDKLERRRTSSDSPSGINF